MVSEQVHRYPRWITWPVELFCALGAALLLARFGRDLLRVLWQIYGMDTALFARITPLREVALAINGGQRLGDIGDTVSPVQFLVALPQLLPALGWLALTLLLVLLVRNGLPTIRTSARGMLVEFSGGWLAVPWESLKAIKVTEDLSAERFVLLAETDKSQLTGWHRFYSALYRIGFRPGFLVISAISDFNGLIKTLLSETDRVARVLDNVKPAKLQEEASSPLFRLLLSPASFFSRRTKTEAVPATFATTPAGGVVRGSYPSRISALFTWGTLLLAALLLFRYITYWLTFLALTFPTLRPLPVFNRLDLRDVSNWWQLVAAHLLVLLVVVVLAALRNLLPELEARGDGLAVRYFNRWIVVPWSRISAIKVTELSEESQIVLIQTSGGLPAAFRLSSMFYYGGFAPSVLVTSALSNFELLLQRIVLEVTRNQTERATAGDAPILQSNAQSSLLLLSFRSGATLDQMVETIREDEESKEINTRKLLRAAGPMFWLALPAALLLLFDRAIAQGALPDGRLIIGSIMLFVLGLLEWPLVSLVTVALDDMTGGGEEGNRVFYLYPTIQLPRLLPVTGALLLVLLGVPILPVLLWIAAIVWSFLLAAGLCEALYDWRGGQLLAGGLVPVVFQLLILLAFLIVRT